jgi:hypothetical protein
MVDRFRQWGMSWWAVAGDTDLIAGATGGGA